MISHAKNILRILTNTVRVLKTNFRLLTIYFIAGCIPLSISFLAFPLGIAKLFFIADNSDISTKNYILFTSLIFILKIIIETFTVIGLMKITEAYLNQTKTNLSELLKFSQRHFWVYFFTISLMNILIYCSTGLSFIVIFLPALIFANYLFFTPFGVVFANKKYMEAIYFSHSIIKNNWWRTLSISFSIFICLFIIKSIVYLSIIAGNFVFLKKQLSFCLTTYFFQLFTLSPLQDVLSSVIMTPCAYAHEFSLLTGSIIISAVKPSLFYFLPIIINSFFNCLNIIAMSIFFLSYSNLLKINRN